MQLRADHQRTTFVMAAVNGARRTQADHPRLPISPVEIAECAEHCWHAGAAALHLHVRTEDGAHSLDPSRYVAALAEIHKRLENALVVQISTESVGRYQPQEQMSVVRQVRPEAASVALRELCPSAAYEPAFADFVLECAEAGIWLQHVLYSPEEITRFASLRASGVIPSTHQSALAVIGSHSQRQPSSTSACDRMLAAAHTVPDCDWSVCAFGRAELPIVMRAARQGCDVRVGFENNLWCADGGVALDNAHLVCEATEALRMAGHYLLSADALRARLRANR